jgi:predicted transposase/invertase (TIGR01784 family)
MTELEFSLTDDILFKMLFIYYPDLLKQLVARLLGIPLESIEEFLITNPNMPPVVIDGKRCRLDIAMTIDGQRVDLEIQVRDEGDYPERSLYYWAREYGTAMVKGMKYNELPRTIVVSIVGFSLFACEEYHSEFRALEVTRHTQLTDRLSLHYYELEKLPNFLDAGDELLLWLKLFIAKTEEDLQQIKALGVPIMEEAIQAYRHVSASDELKELERLRESAWANEASALGHATDVGKDIGREEERKKWEGVVAEKDAEHAAALVEIAAEKDAALAEIARLRALAEKNL